MTAAREVPEYERDLLVQLTLRWGKRVAVKKDEPDLDGHFDAALPDFPAPRPGARPAGRRPARPGRP